jgi:sulfoxide reductase catalytic subunit YedY
MTTHSRSELLRTEIADQGAHLGRRQFLFGSAAAVIAYGAAALGRDSNALGDSLSRLGRDRTGALEGAGAEGSGLKSSTTSVESSRIIVTGECRKEAAYYLEEVLRTATLEERTYRHRCVDGSDAIVPWIGFALSDFLKRCDPTSRAQFVEFRGPREMTRTAGRVGVSNRREVVEALRLDEAMHPLTILAAGSYGKLCAERGASSLRLVVPWKYGFKSVKSIFAIRFSESASRSSRATTAGDYVASSNVNPNRIQRNESQAIERQFGDLFLRKTLMFNGYGEQVASLYDRTE